MSASLPPEPPAKAARGSSDGAIDIAIDDAEPVVEKPASSKKPDASPSSQRVGETTQRAGEVTKRTRAKVTLKIPDDEISRPLVTPSAPPAKLSEPPPPEPPLVPMTPMRIISIEAPVVAAPKGLIPAATRPSAAPPPTVKPASSGSSGSSPDDSWTPYQPTVADRTPSVHPPVVLPRPPRPSGSPPAVQARAPSPSASGHASPPGPIPTAIAVSIPLAPATAPMPPAPPTQPTRRPGDSMDDIPIVDDDGPPSSGEIEVDEDSRPTKPAIESEPKVAVAAPAALAPADGGTPAAPPVALQAVPLSPAAPAPSPVVSGARTSAEGQAAPVSGPIAPTPPRVVSVPVTGAVPASLASQPQVSIKDLPPMRSLAPTEPEALEVHFEDEDPPISSPRPSEPEAEIAAEDLVSVESAPGMAKLVAPTPLVMETPARATPVAVAAATAAAAQAAAAPAQARGSLPPPPSGAKPAAAGKAARVIVPTSSPLAPPPMSESAPTGRRKARPWWEELFNDDFIRTMGKISDGQIAKEVDFVEESLAVAKGAMLLDLACGTGRHAIELTRRGYKVVGFDLSLPMLAKAAEEAQERNQKLNFVQGDMREMTFEDTFDGIYCWNTSFGFFEEEKNAQVIQRVHKALKKGGQFMLEVGNRDYIIRQAPSLAWFEGDGCICMDEMSIDWITSRMKVKRTMMMDDGRTKEIDYSVRIYSLHELGKVLHDAGFRVAEVSGRTGTPGVYFGNESPRTMILAEKK